MMSQAYGKLRSFVQLIFRPDCLYHQTETTDGKEHEEEEEERRRQDKEQEQDDYEATPNGTLTQQASVSPTATLLTSSASCAAEDHVVPPHCGVIRNSSLKTRLLSDTAAPPGVAAAAAAASTTKQVVQNIYRKPMSRIGSNQSLRRSREPHFRPNNSHRLSRHFQLFDSDPGDIHDYYSPTPPPTTTGSDRPGSQGSSTEDDPSAQGSTGYRRRVYTMPSVPTTRGLGQKFHTRMR